MNSIQQQFNSVSKLYDAQRPYLIPCFQDFYTICLPFIGRQPTIKKVLDIGAGTGLFTQFIYQQNPNLHFTLVDISGEMLKVAKERFAGLSNVEFKEADFSAALVGETKYDLIISALAIHHLEDSQKELLYHQVYQALNVGGIFINADQVSGRTPWFDEYYKTHWKETVANSGLNQEAIDRVMERIKLDKFGKLETQLKMLEAAGFNEVDCIYKHNNFVVFGGIKTTNNSLNNHQH